MKRKFNALSWSEWNWQRPFSEEDVKSLLGQLVGLTRRKSIVFEVRMTRNRVQYHLGKNKINVIFTSGFNRTELFSFQESQNAKNFRLRG